MNKAELIKYFKLLLQKWVLWLFVLLDVLAVLVQFFTPNLTLPAIAYGLFAIIGFSWAGYQVYSETVKTYEISLETYRQKLRQLSDEINIAALLKEQNLNMYLKEGHEYVFEFNKSETFQARLENLASALDPSTSKPEKYFLPSSSLYINLRIENVGCDVDILVIKADWEKDYESPFDKYLVDILLSNDTKIEYPVSLRADSYQECVLKIEMPPRSYLTNAQFASRLRDLRENGYSQIMMVSLESVDGSGQKKVFSIKQDISFRPMVDLYIEHWQVVNQTDLIRLAGGVTKKALPPIKAG